MSDYQDFCESFGGCASDPDFMDEWLQNYSSNQNIEPLIKPDNEDKLPKGKLVHIIKLIAYKPAKPVGIIWNKKLADSLPCNNSNYLRSTEHDEPASWFVRKGFTVRSSKKDGYWYQIVYKETNKKTFLAQSEINDYESICSTLNKDWVVNKSI